MVYLAFFMEGMFYGHNERNMLRFSYFLHVMLIRLFFFNFRRATLGAQDLCCVQEKKSGNFFFKREKRV